MKRIKSLYILAALMIFSLGACQKEELIGGTAVQDMSGEWWLQARDTKGAFPFGPSYFHFSTYNTAANLPTEMWLDDLESFWVMKGKVNVDLANKTFSTPKTQNTYYDITFKIDDGKVIPGASKGPISKAVTDSIYFKVEFSDDPGTVYTMSGYRRTKFAEDDH